jgi:hypothetical protein
MKEQVSPNRSATLSRRLFGKNAVASAAVVLLPAVGAAETSNVPAAAPHLGVKPEGLSAADWDEVHQKYTNLLRVYGKGLAQEEKRRLIAILTTNQHMLVSIRSFVVQNGDPSACTLRLL